MNTNNNNNADNNTRYLVVRADCNENMNLDIDRKGPFNTKEEAWDKIVEEYNTTLKQDFEMWEDEPEGKRFDHYFGIAEIVGECTSTHWEIIEIK